MSKRVVLSSLALVALLVAAIAPAAAQSDDPPVVQDRPLLGVVYQDVDGEAVVTQVLPRSAASEAGLQEGDVITAVNGESVDAGSVASIIGSFAPGDTVTLSIRRDGETLEIEATLGTGHPEMDMIMPNMPERAFLGVSLRTGEENDVVIEEVVGGSSAEEAGLKAGDAITAIGDQPISTPQDAVEIIRAMDPGETVAITVDRDGETITVEVELGSQPALAMSIMRIDADVVKYLEDENAWEIVAANSDSILAEAGLQAGDIITAVNGEPLVPGGLSGIEGSVWPDSTITLTVQRGDETLEITASWMAQLALLAASGEMAMMRDLIPGDGNLPFDFQGRGLPFGFDGPRDGPRGDQPFGFNGPHGGPPGDLPFGFDGPHDGPPGEQPFRFDGPRNDQRPFDFRAGGPVKLGIAFVTLDEDTAAEHDVDVTEGALVTVVIPDTPAADAGILTGDIITAVDGDTVDVERTLADRIAAYEPGDTITLELLREGETVEIEVTLEFVDMGAYQFQNQPARPTTPPDA